MRAVLVLVSTTLLASSAYAADLAPRTVEPVAPAYLPFSWTGFYVGGQVGGAWLESKSDPTAGAVFVPFTTKGTGAVFGGQIGYNYQYNQFVFGIEGDFAGSTVKGHSQCSTVIGSACETKQDFLGSVRGRVGYAWDRVLIYGDGGIAFGDDTFRQTAVIPHTFSNDTRVGWTVGLGAEYAFTDHWSAAIEYNYYDFGHKDGTNPPAVGADRIKDTENVVVAKINYRF